MIQVEQDGNLDDYRITKGNSFLMNPITNSASLVFLIYLFLMKTKRKNEIELVHSYRLDRHYQIETERTDDQNMQRTI